MDAIYNGEVGQEGTHVQSRVYLSGGLLASVLRPAHAEGGHSWMLVGSTARMMVRLLNRCGSPG